MERFTIQVPEHVLDDLRDRLARTRFPDQLQGVGWSYGTELSYLRELVAYWRERYDWRAQERALNRFDQYTANIRGLQLHFIHQRSPEPDALPLLITHGWPGSVYEFHKIIGPLTDPAAHGGERRDAFHVVCPSMPGYAFSEAPHDPGFDTAQVAQAEAELMAQLGYARYAAQGGDWGSAVTTQLARLYPERLVGIHLNMLVALPPRGVSDPTQGLSPDELAWVQELAQHRKHGTGYYKIQGTRPQTLGYGLNDSPAGLAAWIVEKFQSWSDCDGDVEKRFTKDELLTNIMLYWVTQSISSSVRLYCENERAPKPFFHGARIEVPTAAAIFKRELYKAPRAWAEAAFNLQRYTVFPRGGHFAALEEPELLVQDLRAFFRARERGLSGS
jgi:pimeloyl-ACP methyl ester carboxylesterase